MNQVITSMTRLKLGEKGAGFKYKYDKSTEKPPLDYEWKAQLCYHV